MRNLSLSIIPLAAVVLLSSVGGLSSVDAMAFGVIGDWGMGGWASYTASGGAEAEVQSVKSFNKMCKKFKCNFTISTGDNIYVGNVMQGLHDSFADMYAPSTGPFFPSVGNHDNAGVQIAYSKTHPKWRFDSRYYSYKLPIDNTGYAVEVFAVDTTDGSLGGGAQYHWLENKLHESTARWKFIFGHYPTMGSGRHKRVGSVGSLQRLMRKYSAQAYFYGHDHIVEVSNVEGAIHGLTGGMTRGGMMWRGIGGANRRYTLTSPNEYDADKMDWPNHGYHICDISPNVLSCGIYHNSDHLGYEYAVTWDWLARTQPKNGNASLIPSEVRKQWPSGREINKALRAEMDLPVGDEVADAAKITVDDKTGKVATVSKAVTSPPTTTTLAPGQTATPVPITTKFQASLVPMMAKSTNAPHLDGELYHPAVFSVSTECEGCRPTHPVANQPFTVTIQDQSVVSDESRHPKVYLSSSPTGCHVEQENRQMLPGTDLYDMKSNSKVFVTTIGRASNVYVCFDDGYGSQKGNFMNLKRINDPGEPTGFMLESPIAVVGAPAATAAGGGGAPAPVKLSLPANVPSGVPLGLVGTTAPVTVAPASNAGHSSLMLIAVGVVCLGGGFGFAFYQKRNEGGGGRSKVAHDEPTNQ